MRTSNLTVVACDVALATLSSLYLAFAYLVGEYRLPHVPICPFLFITGRPCPLCGSTRMIGAFMHGGVSLEWSCLPWIIWFMFVLSLLFVSAVRIVAHITERSTQ